MKRQLINAVAVPVLLALAAVPGLAQTRGGTLLSFDFETKAWPKSAASAVGTIDVAGSSQPSVGLRTAKVVSSGPLALRTGEMNLGKLTLSFSLSASAARPVTVRVESFDAQKKRNGGLQTLIYPAAPDFYQRYALDLSRFRPSGAGKFQPDAPFVGFSFEADSKWKGVIKPEIRLRRKTGAGQSNQRQMHQCRLLAQPVFRR